MGRPFTQRLGVSRAESGKRVVVDALIDTGASFTWIPADMLEELRIRRQQRRRFSFADGRSEYYDIGTAWIRLDGWQGRIGRLLGHQK